MRYSLLEGNGLTGFDHEAVFYEGEDGFLAAVVPYVRQGIDAGEGVLVAVSKRKIALMREQLGLDADKVEFADMAAVGTNPARIIPVWRQFVDRHVTGGNGGRGIGEPVWEGRSPAEIVECQHHECLLNTAFDGGPAWKLFCPYDVSALEPDVIEGARHSHRAVMADGAQVPSDTYQPDLAGRPFTGPLSPVPSHAMMLEFASDGVRLVRRFASEVCKRAGLGPAGSADLALAATEVATNTIQHGGGRGVLRAWGDSSHVHCQISDEGTVLDPLVGRIRPSPGQRGGRGLWLANQLCDLVQIRAMPEGTVVRLSQRLQPRSPFQV